MKRSGFCNARGVCSLVIAGCGILLLVSGIQLFLLPHGGGGARNAAWTFLGLSVSDWTDLHIVTAVFFVGAVVMHLVYNGRTLWRYVGAGSNAGTSHGREILLASVILIGIVAVSLGGWAPSTWIRDLRWNLAGYSPAPTVPWDGFGHKRGFGRRGP